MRCATCWAIRALVVGLLWAGATVGLAPCGVLGAEPTSEFTAADTRGAPGAVSATLDPQPHPATNDPTQLPPERQAQLQEASRKAEAALEAKEPASTEAPARNVSDIMAEIPRINLLDLAVAGGVIMIPIALFSVLVVALGLERWIALRRGAILPRALARGLVAMAGGERGIDPRRAYQLCLKHRSVAANVFRAMLLKVGRPSSELAHAADEVSQREADRLHANVRWLNLSAAVAPMLGLLGTVQGMIKAFYTVSYLPAGVNKAQVLAESIYTALVTTFAGLSVAIPAAILAHLFSGRIRKWFRQIDELAEMLRTELERFERRQRTGSEASLVTRDGSGSAAIGDAHSKTSPPRTAQGLNKPV